MHLRDLGVAPIGDEGKTTEKVWSCVKRIMSALMRSEMSKDMGACDLMAVVALDKVEW